jgi:hypothetical protein
LGKSLKGIPSRSMRGPVGQNYLPSKFGFCFGIISFALVLQTLDLEN